MEIVIANVRKEAEAQIAKKQKQVDDERKAIAMQMELNKKQFEEEKKKVCDQRRRRRREDDMHHMETLTSNDLLRLLRHWNRCCTTGK